MNIRQTSKIKAEGSMSSMTDLVFLLLIFFMILALKATNDKTLPLNLPSAKSNPGTVKNPISVGVRPDGNYIYWDAPNTPLTLTQLEAKLLAETGPKRDKSFKLKADEVADWKYVAAVIEMAYKNELKPLLSYKNN